MLIFQKAYKSIFFLFLVICAPANLASVEVPEIQINEIISIRLHCGGVIP